MSFDAGSVQWVPLSVRESRRWSRRRLTWWWKGARQRVALRLAPWLTPPCHYCHGDGRTLYHGSGDTAILRSCPVCGTGEKIADTTIPNVTVAGG